MNKRRILIVDDEPHVSTLVRLYLEKTERFDVRVENRSAQALTTMNEFQPEMVILDFNMPGMDGSDVLSRLKGDRQFKNTPVVFLTSTVKPAAPGETNRRICGFPFLSKPVGAEELIACVEENLP